MTKKSFVKELMQRVFFSSLTILGMGFFLFIASDPKGSYLTGIAVSVLAAVGCYELAYMGKRKGKTLPASFLAIAGFSLCFSFFIFSQYPSLVALPFTLFFLLSLFSFIFSFHEIQGSLASISQGIFSLAYVSFPLGTLLLTLYFFPAPQGVFWVLYLILVTKITDVIAYFGGNFFGRHKLAVTISPGKTVEGAILGWVGGLLTSVGFIYLAKGLIDLTLYQALFLGLSLPVLGQFGDLVESLFKRDVEQKDSGKLPGIGGVLDLLDSLLLTAPFLYFFLLWRG